jgi:acyl carrier protein
MEVRLDDVTTLVRLQLGRRTVEADSEFQADLGAESIDIQNLITAAEQRYAVTLEDEDLESLLTVRDLFELLRARSSRI